MMGSRPRTKIRAPRRVSDNIAFVQYEPHESANSMHLLQSDQQPLRFRGTSY